MLLGAYCVPFSDSLIHDKDRWLASAELKPYLLVITSLKEEKKKRKSEADKDVKVDFA